MENNEKPQPSPEAIRMKEIRKEMGLSQDEFAKKLKMSRNYICQMEKGWMKPVDKTITYFCKVLGINENWLRTGEGDRYASTTDDDMEIISEVTINDEDSKKAIVAFCKLTPDQRKAICDIIKSLAEKMTE